MSSLDLVSIQLDLVSIQLDLVGIQLDLVSIQLELYCKSASLKNTHFIIYIIYNKQKHNSYINLSHIFEIIFSLFLTSIGHCIDILFLKCKKQKHSHKANIKINFVTVSKYHQIKTLPAYGMYYPVCGKEYYKRSLASNWRVAYDVTAAGFFSFVIWGIN